MRPFILVDLDECIYDFVGALRTWLIMQWGKDPRDLPPPQTWNFASEWGLTMEEFHTACHEATTAGFLFLHGSPLPGTVEALTRLRHYGRVFLVTARDFGEAGSARRNTMMWLTRYGIPFDGLVFTSEKHELGADYALDDKPEFFHLLEDHGTTVFLRDQPWNRDLSWAPRVHSITEFADRVEYLERVYCDHAA
jgi:hypothetical protein